MKQRGLATRQDVGSGLRGGASGAAVVGLSIGSIGLAPVCALRDAYITENSRV